MAGKLTAGDLARKLSLRTNMFSSCKKEETKKISFFRNLKLKLKCFAFVKVFYLPYLGLRFGKIKVYLRKQKIVFLKNPEINS
jgi:hypothetical protein